MLESIADMRRMVLVATAASSPPNNAMRETLENVMVSGFKIIATPMNPTIIAQITRNDTASANQKMLSIGRKNGMVNLSNDASASGMCAIV